eukprot:2730522-Amphidinium_carterae.1
MAEVRHLSGAAQTHCPKPMFPKCQVSDWHGYQCLVEKCQLIMIKVYRACRSKFPFVRGSASAPTITVRIELLKKEDNCMHPARLAARLDVPYGTVYNCCSGNTVLSCMLPRSVHYHGSYCVVHKGYAYASFPFCCVCETQRETQPNFASEPTSAGALDALGPSLGRFSASWGWMRMCKLFVTSFLTPLSHVQEPDVVAGKLEDQKQKLTAVKGLLKENAPIFEAHFVRC